MKYVAASILAILVIAGVMTVVLRGEPPRSGFEQVDTTLTGLSTPTAPTETVSGDQMTVEELATFVFDDAQALARQEVEQSGRSFAPAELVLHRGAVQSACGVSDTSNGPFYCPQDRRVYIDIPFMEQLSAFGAPGDMAQAYVVAHEVGHHVQDQLGILGEVRSLEEQNPDAANELSVRTELQADCLAGVWAASMRDRGLLEPGDIEEGLQAAASVGDDRLQQQTTGVVNADLFTHGTSEQRQAWFRTGFDGGDPSACDTFSGTV